MRPIDQTIARLLGIIFVLLLLRDSVTVENDVEHGTTANAEVWWLALPGGQLRGVAKAWEGARARSQPSAPLYLESGMDEVAAMCERCMIDMA